MSERLTDSAKSLDLLCDPMREDKFNDATGIYVRARSLRDGIGSFDMAQLDDDSLQRWLNSSPGLATNTVRALLGYGEYGK